MSFADVVPLLTLLLLSVSPVVMMLTVAFRRDHALIATLAALGLGLAFLALPPLTVKMPVDVMGLLVIDGYSVILTGLVTLACLFVVFFSYPYLEWFGPRREEYYILLLLVAAGATVVVSSKHFVSFFLGLEILSVSMYAMIAYPRASRLHVEAGVKYLILAAVADAFLLFGMALTYARCGSMDLAVVCACGSGDGLLTLAGSALLVVGLGFKLSLVPFHMWTPDVYQGAPAPVTALLATVSKLAVFGFLFRFFSGFELRGHHALEVLFTVVAVGSMVVGNLLALLQDNVKRMLAYSSIAHFGYLLVAFIAASKIAPVSVAFYLIAYTVTTLGAFGVVTAMSGPEREAELIGDYRGMAWERPGPAAIFTLMLLSLAGIPLTAGFVGKFYLVAAGMSSVLLFLVACLVVTSVMGMYYYLRVIIVMFGRVPDAGPDDRVRPGNSFWTTDVGLAVLTILILWLGVYPSSVLRLIEAALTAV